MHMLKQSHRILVVDDEPTNLLMLEKLLKPSYTVCTAASGEQALEWIRREEFSLLITDQRMPGMKGTELLRQSQILRPAMVSMLLTSNKDSQTFIDAVVNSGAVRVVTKPWEPDDLLSVVETSLRMYESNLERQGAMDRLKLINESLDRIVNRQS
jgi:DNA-binding NtrC family response regulator